MTSCCNFPSLTSVDSSLYRQRLLNYLALPKTLADLALTGEWCLTDHDERFLLIDDSCKFFYLF